MDNRVAACQAWPRSLAEREQGCMLLIVACRWEPHLGLNLGHGLISSQRLQQPVRQESMCQCLVRHAGMRAQVQKVGLSGMTTLIG